MVENSWPSARESFEIEDPGALEIESSRLRLSNASDRTKRTSSMRFILLLVLGMVIAGIPILLYFCMKTSDAIAITPLAIDGSIWDEGISYGSLKTKNGMRIVLGEAVNANYAFVSFCLGIGYLSEPKELAGVMSVLAETLLTGSKKYPQGKKWWQQNCGKHNRHPIVEATQTCYAFQVKNASLNEALDRLMDALVDPLFESNNLQTVIKRFKDSYFEVDKSYGHIGKSYSFMSKFVAEINPDHPMHYHDRLGDNLQAGDAQDKVFSFFKQYFNAQDMTLSVIAPQTLAQLGLLVNRFAMLPGRPDHGPTPRGPQYDGKGPDVPKHFAGLVCWAMPGMPIEIVFSWSLSDFQRNRWREKPWFYAMELLNRAGEGSLVGFLKEKKFAHAIIATRADEGVYSTFHIIIRLTSDGLDHIVEVGTAIFQYLGSLRTQPPTRILDWLKEAQLLQDLNFRYVPAEEGYARPRMMYLHRVDVIAKGLLSYPEQYVVSAPHRLFHTDADAQLQFLSDLKVDSARVTVIAQEHSDICAQESSIPDDAEVKPPYLKTQLTQEMLNGWSSEQDATLPPRKFVIFVSGTLQKKNSFLPVDTKLVPSSTEGEKNISMQLLPPKNMVRVFSLTNTQYRSPKVFSYIRIFSDIFNADVADTEASRIRILTWGNALRLIVQTNLSSLQQIHRWSVLDVSVDVIAGCLEIHVQVLGDLLPTMIRNIAQHIISLEDLPAHDALFKMAFHATKKQLLSNYLHVNPAWYGDQQYKELFVKSSFAYDQTLSALDTLEFKGLKGEPEWLLHKSAIEVLVVGNVLPQQAEQWSRVLARELRLEGREDFLKRARALGSRQLPEGTTLWKVPRPTSTSHNGVNLYIQFPKGGDDESDDEIDAALRLFLYLVHSYDITKKLRSLGITMLHDEHGHQYGSHTLILWGSTLFEPAAIQRILHNWFGKSAQWVMGLDEATFNKRRNNFVNQAGTPEMVEDLWLPIMQDFRSRRFTFDYMRRTKKAISDFTLPKFKLFLKRHVGACRKLYMQVTRTDGKTNQLLEGELKELAEPDSSMGDLAFDRTWWTQIPSSFKHEATQRRHSDLAESVPKLIPVPELSSFRGVDIDT